VVDRKRIRCLTAIAREEIAQWPGVVSASAEGRHLVVVTTEAETIVRRLVNGDASVRDLEIQRAGLAEAFAELTKEAA
jgi:ABC-2 type transport system ATP-binding protein